MAKTIRHASRNLTIIDGDIVGVVQIRATANGPQLSFEVRADTPDRSGALRSVVATVVYSVCTSDPWNDTSLPAEGERVLVVGATRRRFFRTGAATVSRTEVEAHTILVGPDRRRAKALREAVCWAST